MKNYLRIGCFVLLLFALSVSAVAQENQAMINSSDLLQQIERGEDVFIEGKTIKGKLNLSEGNFSLNEDGLYIITSEIVFEGSDFNEIDFSNVLFENDVRFASTTICKSFFNNVKFNGDAEFRNTTYRFGVVFDNVTFKNNSDFYGIKVGGMPIFKNTDFERDVYFNSLESDCQILFSDVTFHEDVMFRGNFLAPDIRFSDVNFEGMADFQLARFTILSFSNTTFSLISLTDTDYNETYIEWKEIKGKLIFNGNAYLKLRNNFINQGKYPEADGVYYQYRKNLRERKEFLDSIPDLIMEVTCGYGVKPEKTLSLGVVLIIGFSFYYFNIMQNIIVYRQKKPLKNYIDAFWISVGVFTNSGYEKDDLKYRHRYAIAIERILGWLILTLFIVTLTNVMVRP